MAEYVSIQSEAIMDETVDMYGNVVSSEESAEIW